MFHLIAVLFFGLIVGLLARFFMPGRDSMGWIVTSLLGVAGAFTATFVGQQLHWYGPNDAAGYIASILGAMFLLFIYRMIATRTA
ncbi:MAG: GlsB/YeaQ/YmgE family stress response membrane protein [Candidatus Methylacidiphilales bacterium]|nr:GlsB/YeaQ/YmgE family stress response membrane protein [Candidatus Methylacidiphilales bacterium]